MRSYADKALKNALAYGLTEQDMEGQLYYPSVTFDKRMEIDLGDRTVELAISATRIPRIIVVVPDRGAFRGTSCSRTMF
jgi:hypothetical protein